MKFLAFILMLTTSLTLYAAEKDSEADIHKCFNNYIENIQKLKCQGDDEKCYSSSFEQANTCKALDTTSQATSNFCNPPSQCTYALGCFAGQYAKECNFSYYVRKGHL